MSKELKCFFVGSSVFVLLAMTRWALPLHNMEFFVVMCAVFVAAMLLAYWFMERNNSSTNQVIEKVWSILASVLLIIWIILFYINETNADHPLNKDDLIRRYFPFPLWITLMAVGVIISLLLMRKEPGNSGSGIRKKIRVIVSLLFTVGVSVQFYAPNIFQDIQGRTYHSHAYTNSIINACWLIPYSEDMESLYGHYGILYMPALKFLHKCFHVDYLTGIFIASAVLAGFSILLFLYILNFFAKNDVIFYLGMFAIGEEYFMLMQGGVFLQVHPHRMIFPMILMALALWEYKKGRRYNIMAVCFITLSFVWSTEVGIVIMCSFAFYRWVQGIMDGQAFSLRKGLLLIRELAVYVLLPFGLSYLVINGYNLLAGGKLLDLKEFMFPLISDRNYIDLIELPLPDVTHAWVGGTILFMGAVMPALFEVFWPTQKECGLKSFYFLLGLMSLMLMLYYINRPVEGSMFIILFLMLILQAVILQKSQDAYQDWKKRKDPVFEKPNRFLLLCLRVVTTFILFVMAFDSIYSMPKAWKTSAETIWKRDELMEFAEYVYFQVPPDAISFGEGVPELMSMIDRDTHLHTTEWSYRNMPLDTMERIRYRLEGEQWFFCSLKGLAEMQSNFPGLTDNYYVHEVFEYNGENFGFFRINE
ncbi:hypothetical protein [Parablautia muri]|uniref:Uncharacterized protein n=1 Tax=Parablautia muri TaxID=2320879 RepID=A0A9X5BHC7_9FIRM|nr:hypothetical protein [Parablautia muri]NBJ94080.1 hypothetical protein [Parablautia muri]